MTSSRYDIPGKKPQHAAAALHTLGFTVACSADRSEASAGTTTARWYVSNAPADARDLCMGGGEKAALFRAMLTGLTIREAVDAWRHSLCDWDAIAGTIGTMQMPAEAQPPCRTVPFERADFAALAIFCGHRPMARVQRGGYVLEDRSISTSLDDLMLVERSRAMREAGGIAQAIALPGYPPEEHPAFYVREAIARLHIVRLEEAAALNNPTLMMSGVHGVTALVSESVMADGGRPAELVELHLAGRL